MLHEFMQQGIKQHPQKHLKNIYIFEVVGRKKFFIKLFTKQFHKHFPKNNLLLLISYNHYGLLMFYK